jgi:ankyrin repeat protein
MVEAGTDVNLKNNDSWAPLHSAIRKGNAETVDALLEVRLNINSRSPLDLNILGGPIDMTPLHIACCAN